MCVRGHKERWAAGLRNAGKGHFAIELQGKINLRAAFRIPCIKPNRIDILLRERKNEAAVFEIARGRAHCGTGKDRITDQHLRCRITTDQFHAGWRGFGHPFQNKITDDIEPTLGVSAVF